MNLNTIEVPLGTRPTTRAEEAQIINAEPSEYVYNRAKGQLDKTLDASIDASIVINSEDREYINEECSETNKLLKNRFPFVVSIINDPYGFAVAWSYSSSNPSISITLLISS